MHFLYCPICQQKITKTYSVSAEILLFRHIHDHHSDTEINLAQHPCSGCDAERAVDDAVPQPFLALILQDEGPAKWQEVDYCRDCVESVKEDGNSDVLELVPRKPIYLREI